ncbi:MAG: hypothetical protein RL077_5241 [Verrucomicrobiota bacterium]
MKAWVLDTNVVVSGFLKPHAPPARLLSAFFARRLRLVYDARMLAEYGEVLARPEFGISHHDYIGFLLMLRTSGELLRPSPVVIALPDLDDLPFIETGLASDGKIVVTKNLAHFQPAAKFGLRILLPAEAQRALEDGTAS